MYMLNGATIVTSGPPAMTENPLVTLVSAADFNGDGNADALLRRTDGRWTLYSFSGLAILNQGTVDMTKNIAYQLIASDDFNEDNKADALLRRNDGRWVLYGLDGNGPTILGKGMPDMKRNIDWVPQVD